MKVLPTVFVVDDDRMVLESLNAVLSAEGHVVKCFSAAEEFLAILEPNSVGCIVIDLILPGMSGETLWKTLDVRGSLLSVIMVTGWIESLDLSWQRSPSGVVVEKPYDVAALLSLVENGIAESLDRRAGQHR